jgi:septum site-determining protein MinC
MKNTVIIKGNRYGISIVLDEKAEFSQLLEDLAKRLKDAESFFDSEKQLAVAFEGRILTNEELDQVLTVIGENSKLNIQYVMDENSDLEATFFDIIHSQEDEEKKSKEPDSADSEGLTEIFPVFGSGDNAGQTTTASAGESMENSGLFYRGTLRSGQTLEAKESLVVIGDINPGATVIAGGNIIVIGALNGSVTAGAKGTGNPDAFVLALSMNPIQIQIADIIARNADGKKHIKPQKEAMIARIENEQIVMEPVSKSAIQDIYI